MKKVRNFSTCPDGRRVKAPHQSPPSCRTSTVVESPRDLDNRQKTRDPECRERSMIRKRKEAGPASGKQKLGALGAISSAGAERKGLRIV
jgi:hypothetical protein